jgi:hypothetical protein
MNAKNAAAAATAMPCPIDLDDSHKDKAAVLSKVLMENMRSAARTLSHDGTFFGDDDDKHGIVELACAHAALEEIVDLVDDLQSHVRNLQGELEAASDERADLLAEAEKSADVTAYKMVHPVMSVEDLAALCDMSVGQVREILASVHPDTHARAVSIINMQALVGGLMRQHGEKSRAERLTHAQAVKAGLVADTVNLPFGTPISVAGQDYVLQEPAAGTNPEAMAHAKLSTKHTYADVATPYRIRIYVDGSDVILTGREDNVDYLLGAASHGGCDWTV